jgi:hypothetical protein
MAFSVLGFERRPLELEGGGEEAGLGVPSRMLEHNTARALKLP